MVPHYQVTYLLKFQKVRNVPGSIPGATRFLKISWVWNGAHSAS
jgi:hypothetical protein